MKTTFAQTSEGVTQSPLDNSTKLATTAYADNAITTLAAYAGGYNQSDGVTSNRANGIYGPFDAVNNVRGWVAGAATLTLWMRVAMPSSFPATGYVGISPNTTVGNVGLQLQFRGDGTFLLRQFGATSGDYRSSQSSVFTAYLNRTIIIEVVITKGTSAPVFYIDGVNVSGIFTNSTTGTFPEWLDAGLQSTYFVNGLNWPAGVAPEVTPILGTLSDADSAFWLSTGKPPAWVVAGGSCANYNPAGTGLSVGAVDAAVAGLGDTFNTTVSAPAGTRTGGAGSFVTRMALTSGIGDAKTGQIFSFPAGAKLLVSGWVIKSVGATATTMKVSLRGATPGTLTSAESTLSISTSWSFFSTVIDATAVSTRFSFTLTSTSGDYIELDDVQAQPLGAMTLPSVQPINVIDDVSGIGGNQGRTLGMTAVTQKTNWRISSNTWTSGNQQILAGNVLDSTKDVIDLVEQSTAGTPTTTIGSASAGTQYKASAALTAGINPVTLVTRKLASNAVWINATSTDVVRTTIVGHRTT